ncbi:hypothetical protein EV122DRAFT_284869 [Schizophyllum commune]
MDALCDFFTVQKQPGDGSPHYYDLDLQPFNEDNDDSDSEVGDDGPPQRTTSFDEHTQPSSDEEDGENIAMTPRLDFGIVISPAVFPSTRTDFGEEELIEMPGVCFHPLLRLGQIEDEGNYGCVSSLPRYPELVMMTTKKMALSKQVVAKIVRVLLYCDESRTHNYLILDKDGNPCAAPSDRNDLWARILSDGSDWPEPPRMCLQSCLLNGIWDPSLCGQSRYCQRCRAFRHVKCLASSEIVDLPAFLREQPGFLDMSNQKYLQPLFDPSRPVETVEIPWVVTYKNLETEHDIHDTAGRVPMADTTWGEIAMLPIRRRTSPGQAPETNEVIIQLARRQFPAWSQKKVKNLHKLLIEEGLCPQAGVRGAKYILLKDLRKLRGHTMRYFQCPGCHAQII